MSGKVVLTGPGYTLNVYVWPEDEQLAFVVERRCENQVAILREALKAFDKVQS